MDSFANHTPVWDLSQASSFSQLPDDDFLALLQKQFPSTNDPQYQPNGVFTNGVNPQTISRYSLPTVTPPSEDSDPSTPNTNNNESTARSNENDDPMLKRKASEEDFDDEGPSQKNQHTSNNGKKGSRRKSSGSGPDESRLLKRKEQNRAAQRAFRERKEKHVKDLEDKVAALEAKNDQSQSENENLRDLLSRLQNENIQLKQGPFTFSVARPNTGASIDLPAPTSKESPRNLPDLPHPSSLNSAPTLVPDTSKADSLAFDWGSLTSFDPSVLNLLDDNPQPTATDASMQMDFGFGPTSTYTTIASNPLFMSFAETFDSSSPITTQTQNDPFNFGLSTWPTTSPSLKDQGSLDELFGGYLTSQPPVDFNVLNSPPSSIGSVAHRSGSISSSSPSNSTGSTFGTPKDSSASEPEMYHHDGLAKRCPKTKEEVEHMIAVTGPSTFAPSLPPGMRKSEDPVFGPIIPCNGTKFPKTEKSDKNIEVLSAWRSITSNPRFKDVDINELCTEFTSKARCDGTKVVLEPQGVTHILQTLSKQQQQ